jgi:predicted site-specific integrase-resolvase
LKIRTFYEYIGAVTKESLSNRCAMIPQKRVAIYARVSTTDRGHDPETQLLVLREYVARRGFMCVGEYVEYASGTGEDRPRYRALPKSARKRQLDDAARVSSDSREGGYDVCYRRAAVA